MIFKLQRPLNWTDGRPTKEGDILAYNEDGTVNMTVRQSDDVLAMFADQANIYVQANRDRENGGLRITGIVDDLHW